MITQEEVILNGRTFLHTFSDKYVIKQIETNTEYDEAYDIIPCKYTYKETDKELPIVEQPEEPQEAEVIE